MPSPEKLLMLIVIGCASAVALVLRAMRGKWKDVNWSDPTVLAAIIAGSAGLGVAVAGAISGSISAAYQSAAEGEKNRGDLLNHALLAFDPHKTLEQNQDDLRQRVKVLIQSGVVPDDNGSICRAFVGGDCPLKILDHP
jgi:hypothetical protein